MRAAVVSAPGQVSVETIADPSPQRDEVIVQVAACGLCGTDLHIARGGFAPSLPLVPGHEFAGVVVEAGADVARTTVGDRVAVDPSLFCHACHYCRLGRNLCEYWGGIGVTRSGGAAEYVAVPAANCVLLPDHVATADAALVEPLSCAVRGYDVLRSQVAARVLIYGAGTMGLMMLHLAHRVGAASVDVVDTNQDRLAVAQRVGVTHAVSTPDGIEPRYGWDVVVDATGNAQAIQDGLRRVAPGGTFLQFGVADPDTRAEIEPFRVYNKEITITGSMAVLHSYDRAADLFAAGVLDPELFITDRVPLADFATALEAFGSGRGLKTQVVPGTV